MMLPSDVLFVVEVVAVHIDAVIKIPYYTIMLPDGSLKQTNWDSLMTLSEYKKLKSATTFMVGKDGKDDDPTLRSGSRMRSMFGFSSRSRGGRVDSTRSRSCSSRRGREQERERERSASRQSRRSCSGQRRHSSRRSSSKGQAGDDDVHSACLFSSQASISRSTHDSDSNQGDVGDKAKGFGNGDVHRNHRGRPRSQSPFPRRHEVEELGDRHDRRSRPTKKYQHLPCHQPRAKNGRTVFRDKKSIDSSSRTTKHEHQASVGSDFSMDANATKKRDGEGGAGASDSNHCHGPLPHGSSCVSVERSGDSETAKKSLECVRGIVVEEVHEDSSCW